jgi:hypothetical protein
MLFLFYLVTINHSIKRCTSLVKNSFRKISNDLQGVKVKEKIHYQRNLIESVLFFEFSFVMAYVIHVSRKLEILWIL